VDEEHKKQIAVWLAKWPAGSRGLHLTAGRVQLRVTVETYEMRQGGWPTLRLRDELGHTRWCAFGNRSALEKEDSRG
jgi:hypothetical protein